MDFQLSITWAEYAQAVIGLFAIVNPFSTIPVFLGLTEGDSDAERRKIAFKTATSTFIIMFVVYLVGEWILWFFGISVSSFRIAGGILIMGVAFSMLQAKQSSTKQTPEEADEAQDKKSIAVVPLSLPLMAGPGTISMVIVASSRTQGIYDHTGMLVALCSIAVSIWLILGSASLIANKMGKTGMNIATRIMGLILAAIAVEFIIKGLTEKFPGWLT